MRNVDLTPQAVCTFVETAYAASDGANHLDRDLGAKLALLTARPFAQSIDLCSAQGDEMTIERAKRFKKSILSSVR
jgi:hypothetical protein